MKLTVFRLDFTAENVNGPFSVIDALVHVPYNTLASYAKSGVLFWGDHSKLSYYSFAEVQSSMQKMPFWVFPPPTLDETISAQYGRVYIYKYDSCYVVRDNFTMEMYLAKDIRTAFEIAVMVVHLFPDERVYPILPSDEVVGKMQFVPTTLDYDIINTVEQPMVWVESDKAPMSNSRSVNLSLADAVSLLMGDKPSAEFIAEVGAVYPSALIAAYGAPIIAYNQNTTKIGVAKCLTSLALSLNIEPKIALDNFVKHKTIGDYKIVGGWGYDFLENERDRLAVIDFALSHSSSPDMMLAKVASLS
jgi:hypothetical protein